MLHWAFNLMREIPKWRWDDTFKAGQNWNVFQTLASGCSFYICHFVHLESSLYPEHLCRLKWTQFPLNHQSALQRSFDPPGHLLYYCGGQISSPQLYWHHYTYNSLIYCLQPFREWRAQSFLPLRECFSLESSVKITTFAQVLHTAYKSEVPESFLFWPLSVCFNL